MQSPQELLHGAVEPLKAPSANAPSKELHLACVLKHQISPCARPRIQLPLPPRTETGEAWNNMPSISGPTLYIVMQLFCQLAGETGLPWHAAHLPSNSSLHHSLPTSLHPHVWLLHKTSAGLARA